MKRLPPAKRNQLIVVLLATAGLISLVYFLLIHPQNGKNIDLGIKISQETARLQQYKTSIKQMDATTSALKDLTDQLNHAEKDIASGDLYQWTYDTIRGFKTAYRVEIPNPGQQPALSECDLVGNFPYKQMRFTLNGTGFYHDLGKFISDFENKFPHCRVVNLSADSAGNSATSSERLNFRMDIIALVKPSN
jgi:Tfp pilus assembly protein PilO